MIRISLCLLLLVASSLSYGQALRDPTKPMGWSNNSEVLKDMELSAILTRNQQSMAVINGKIRKEGELINGYSIIKIEPNTVYLQNSNGMFMIQLVDDEIITPASNTK